MSILSAISNKITSVPVFWRRFIITGLSALPALYILQLVVRIQTGEWDLLGPEPGKALVWLTGTWAFNFLLIALVVTPLYRLLNQRWVLVHRRMLGLWAFLYTSLHALAYATFLLQWQWADITSEIVKRPYLLLGTGAWTILLALALTSTRWAQKSLGKRWKALHKLVYFAALLASVHYLLQIRAGWFEPVLYTVLTILVLLVRNRRFEGFWKKSDKI